jgi:peroxiredoxin
MRPSSAVIVAGVILAGFTIWITRQAKALEKDLDSTSQKIVLLDKLAPDFHLTTYDGHNVALSDYRGRKKLALIFWASWNNGSHPQMLMLGQTYRRIHTDDSDFDVVAIAVDDDAAAVKQFVTDSKITFPVVLDHERAVTNAYQIRRVPTALVIDTSGKVVYGAVGFARERQGDFANQLGLSRDVFQLEMGAPHGRRN